MNSKATPLSSSPLDKIVMRFNKTDLLFIYIVRNRDSSKI